MKLPEFDFSGPGETFLAVFLGAFLATIGGLAAGQIEQFFHRRAQERTAALLFGETLATLGVLLRLADQMKGVGDPYGPMTMRMLRLARREIDIYDRNRETLYILRDSALRVRLHTAILRLTMPLESVLEYTDEIAAARTQLKNAKPADRADIEAEIALREGRREQGFEFVSEQRPALREIADALGRIARHSFGAMDHVGPGGLGTF